MFDTPSKHLPTDTVKRASGQNKVAELITMLVRFRTQADASVTATLADDVERHPTPTRILVPNHH